MRSLHLLGEDFPDQDLELGYVGLHGRLLTHQLLDEVVLLLELGLQSITLGLIQGNVVT